MEGPTFIRRRHFHPNLIMKTKNPKHARVAAPALSSWKLLLLIVSGAAYLQTISILYFTFEDDDVSVVAPPAPNADTNAVTATAVTIDDKPVWSLGIHSGQSSLLAHPVTPILPDLEPNVGFLPIWLPQLHLKRTNTTDNGTVSGTIDKNHAQESLQLRFDWTGEQQLGLQPSPLSSVSSLARRMLAHQNNCSLPTGDFWYRNRFGLGSDLHVWSQAMCNAMELNVRLQTLLPWIWRDEETCDGTGAASTVSSSAMTCYFPRSELQCPVQVEKEKVGQISSRQNISRGRGRVRQECPSILAAHNVSDVRAAAIEFLFAGGVSQAVQQEAVRQLNLVFSSRTTNPSDGAGGIPNDLITVHIRWGDKADEMKKKGVVPMQDYISAVKGILRAKGKPVDQANIFLSTEDPRAVKEMRAMAPVGWKIYVDQYFYEMLPHRQQQQKQAQQESNSNNTTEVYNGSPKMSRKLQGKPGLMALGSLLVAMEANDFVLTTTSNWSRLMNELRTNVLDPRCQGCTSMVDLYHGEW